MPSEVICITKERRDFAMDKDSVLYLLMDMRVNGMVHGVSFPETAVFPCGLSPVRPAMHRL